VQLYPNNRNVFRRIGANPHLPVFRVEHGEFGPFASGCFNNDGFVWAADDRESVLSKTEGGQVYNLRRRVILSSFGHEKEMRKRSAN
jgi:hypothetical protein